MKDIQRTKHTAWVLAGAFACLLAILAFLLAGRRGDDRHPMPGGTGVSGPFLPPASTAGEGETAADPPDPDLPPGGREVLLRESVGVVVLDEATGAPLARAVVDACPLLDPSTVIPDLVRALTGGRGPERTSLVTNRDGVAWLPSGGGWEVIARADGHIPRIEIGEFGSQGLVLRLRPAAALELVFRDPQGEPVEGVEAVALPPRAPGEEWGNDWGFELREWQAHEQEIRDRLAAGAELPDSRASSPPGLGPGMAELLGILTLRRRSDSEGRITWSDLPPGEGWRWALASRHHAALRPEYERPRVSFKPDGAVVRHAGIPTRISGPISLQAGEPTGIEVLVTPGIAAWGRIVPAAPGFTERPVIRLLASREVVSPGGIAVREREHETNARADAEGRFLLENLSPGEKLLRATWVEGEAQHCFASLEFALVEGESMDLGDLRAQAGTDLLLEIRVVDEAGETLDPAGLFDRPEKARVMVHLSAGTVRVSPARKTSEVLEVPLNEVITLAGLPGTSATLWVATGREWPSLRSPERALRWPKQFTIELPHSGPLVVPLIVQELVPCTIRMPYPAGERPFDAKACVVFSAERRTEDEDLYPPFAPEAGEATATMYLPAGHCHLLVHTQAPREPEGTASYYFIDEIDVVPGVEVLANLQKGAMIEGRLLTPRAEPRAGEFVTAAFGPWLGDGRDRSGAPYIAITDGQGRYRLRGLPPRVEMRLSGMGFGAKVVRTGAEGSSTVVDLVTDP
ncbi:MAG: hypothetical protein AB1726_07380 [Planctomycetota bacterium]